MWSSPQDSRTTLCSHRTALHRSGQVGRIHLEIGFSCFLKTE